MSYRKKHYPAKPEKPEKDFPLSDVEYGRPGTERSLFTGRLTSGLPYQRPVDEKEVNRLIREWDDRLLDPLVVSFRDGQRGYGALYHIQRVNLRTGSGPVL